MQTEHIRELVQHYKDNKCLWDAREDKFYVKKHRDDVWNNIAAQMNISTQVLKDKMMSLLGSYRREKSREKKSNTYKSKWFAYKWFNFLSERNYPKSTDHSAAAAEEGEYTSAHAGEDIQCADTQQHDDDEQTERTAKRIRRIERPARKRHSTPTLLIDIREDVANALKRIDHVINDQQLKNIDEDEYDLYARLLAKRLRTFSQRESQEIMYEIDGLILNRVYNRKDPMPSGDFVSSAPASPASVVVIKRSVSSESPYASPEPSP